MIVLAAANEVFTPGQAVFLHPAPALAHALCQNHVYTGYGMAHTLNIYDLPYAKFSKELVKIHLMNHALDIGHTDLERTMVVLFISKGIKPLTKLRGDQPLAVKLQHLNIHRFLHTGIASHRRV